MATSMGGDRGYLDDLLDELSDLDVGALTRVVERMVDSSRLECVQNGHDSPSEPEPKTLADRSKGEDTPYTQGCICNLERVLEETQANFYLRGAFLRITRALGKYDSKTIEGIADHLLEAVEGKGCPAQAARVVALLSLFKAAEVEGFADAIEEPQNQGDSGIRSAQAVNAREVGELRVIQVPDSVSCGRFATAGDAIVCKYHGPVGELPKSTARARNDALLGSWLLIQKDGANGVDCLICQSKFGSRRLSGQGWQTKSGYRPDCVWFRPYESGWSVYTVVSVRRAKPREYRTDHEFCDALSACGFTVGEGGEMC